MKMTTKLSVDCREWDEYFHLCALSEQYRPDKARCGMYAERRLVLLKRIRTGVLPIPPTQYEAVKKFITKNPLCDFLTIHEGTKVPWDDIKRIVTYDRRSPVFHIIRMDIGYGDEVFYAATERAVRTKADKLGLVARWAEIKGLIDPEEYYCPLNMTKDKLIDLCRELRLESRIVQIGEEKRERFYVRSR